MAAFTGWRLTRAGIIVVIGVVLLTALAFVSVYIVVQRGEQARRDEAIAVAEEQLTADTEVIAEETPAKEAAVVAVNDTANAEAAAPVAEVLPETGASPAVIIVAATITMAGAYYVQSRRAVRGL